MNKFTTSEALSYGWKKTKEQFWLIAGVLVAYSAISIVISSIEKSNTVKENIVLAIVLFIISITVGTILKIGLMKFFLNANEGKGQFADLFSAHGTFFTYFIGSTALGIITIVGILLLIVPGIIFAMMYFFTLFLIVDRKMEIIDAFKESAAMTKGSRWDLFGFVAVAGLINILGAIALVIGLLVTVPITAFATIYVYKALLNAEIPMTTATPIEPASTM